ETRSFACWSLAYCRWHSLINDMAGCPGIALRHFNRARRPRNERITLVLAHCGRTRTVGSGSPSQLMAQLAEFNVVFLQIGSGGVLWSNQNRCGVLFPGTYPRAHGHTRDLRQWPFAHARQPEGGPSQTPLALSPLWSDASGRISGAA